MQLVSKNHFSLSNLYVPFLLSHESKANISETPNTKGRKYIYMNLKETRDKLIGNNAEKLKLLNSNYLDQTVELLKSDFTDEDFKINLQIISALAITKNSNAKSKIRKIIPSYFETARDYVNAVVSNFNDNNSNTIYTLEEFIVNAVENKANTIEIDSYEEDSNYVKFDWKDEKQKNEQFGRADKSLPIGEQISQTNGDNRFIIVDLEHHTPSNESTLNYIYEESNHRFILQSDGAQDMPELPSPLDLQRQDSDDDLAYDMDPGMIPLRVRRNFDINDGSILDAPRSAESQSTAISVVSNINDRIEEIISGDNFSEFRSPNFSRNDISEPVDYHSADDMSRTNQTDEELVRLINYIQSSRTSNQTDVANSIRSDLASDITRQNFQNSNSYEYDELNIPALNSVLVRDRLSEEETERISASLNDYRRRSDLLVAIRNEANDETNNHYQYEQVLQPIPLLDALREAVFVDGMQDAYQCDDQYNDTATKTLVTPLPSAAVNVCKDDMLFSDSQVTQNADESYHESDFADQFMVNMKSTIVYTYPPQSKQDVMVSIFQSLFHIVKETSYFSDGILFFVLWFLKNENSAFLEKYYRKCCMDNAHKILLCLSIRDRTNDMIDSICYIKDFKIDKFNIQAYKSVMTKSNNHLVDFDHIYKLVNGAFGDFSFNALECYINYAKNIDSKKKEAHYMKIVGLMKKTIHKDTNKTLLLLSKLALYSEEAQNICNKNHMVEMTIVTFNKQMMLGHSPKYAIFCLYSLCDAWEQNRKIVIKQKIMATVFDIFKRKLKEKNFDKEFLAIVCLIKCMTRCVQFLTSELLEFPIMELFLLAIKNASKIKNSNNFDVSTIFSTTDCNEKELCAFAILKESFCVLSNLVMDHGNYKDKFLSKNGLKIIYSVGKKTNLEFYMLFLLKNFLYECTWPVKETFMEVFTNEKYKIKAKKAKNQNTHKDLSDEPLPLSDEYNHETNSIDNYVKNTIQHISKTLESGKFYIQTYSKNIFTRTFLKYNKINLNKTNHRTRSRLKTMKEMFNVIRNMVCASKDETFDFFIYYPAILENTILYFIRLMRSTNFNTQKKRVIIETIYIFSNICASTDEYKDIFMQPFFTAEIQKLFSIRNRDVILAMVWFITNLSWIEDESGYERNKRMVEIGYKKYLLDMSAIDAYIHDKAVHAIDNLST